MEETAVRLGGGLLKATSQAGVGPGSAFPNSWLGPPALTLVPISLLGLDSGFCTISRLPRPEKPRDRDRDSSFPAEPELRRSDSLLSFRLDLDLGPSLLTELLGAMVKKWEKLGAGLDLEVFDLLTWPRISSPIVPPTLSWYVPLL